MKNEEPIIITEAIIKAGGWSPNARALCHSERGDGVRGGDRNIIRSSKREKSGKEESASPSSPLKEPVMNPIPLLPIVYKMVEM